MTPCGNCGLPAPAGDRFCCYGCELAAGVRAQGDADHGHLYGTLCLVAVLAMIVMMLSLFLYAEDVFDVAGEPEMAWMRAGYRWASAVLTTPVMLLAGWPLLKGAFARWRSMDALIAVGAWSAYLTSCLALARGQTHVYFETATTALSLATFGRYLEATARSQASRSLGPLLEVARRLVRVETATGPQLVAAAAIEPGMRVTVDAEQVVPVDLELTSPKAEVDLAVLTGEARAVTRCAGETIPAGAVASGVPLEGLALRPARDSALERLCALARELSERPPAGLRWADAFATALAPAACVIAVAAAVHGAALDSPGAGIARGLAVLLAACPCAYAIASPLVYWLALRAAFGHGVLIRTADALEALAGVRVVVFDKTGTLTLPDAVVTHMRHASSTASRATASRAETSSTECGEPAVASLEVRSLLRALEEGTAHPVGRALHALAGDVTPAALDARRFVVGHGVTARDAAGRAIAVGLGADGRPALTRDGEVLATFDVSEVLRPEARAAVDALHAQGVAVQILSGDDRSRVEIVAAALGVPARARLSPADKVAALGALGDGTAMVGDGVNDAPALAGRLTSFTIGSAAPLARGVAQVTLLVPDLTLVPWTLAHARHALSVVRRLLVAATLYNLVFVGMAALGYLKPAWAGLSMLGSSLLSLAFASRVGGLDDIAPETPVLARDRATGEAA